MKRIIFISLFSLGIFSHFPLTSGWLERKAEGWAWYEEVEKKEDQEMTPESLEKAVRLEEPSLSSAPSSASASQKAAEIRKNLEEKLAQAVLEPTPENVEAYMREQQKWMNQSARFSDQWVKALLKQPDLDATHEFPVSQYGIQLYKQLEQERRDALMQKLNQQYGLFFFYEGQEKSSQVFSFVVKEMVKKYGWEVIAISKDGLILDGFRDNHPDNGIIQRMGVKVFPSLFLVNPSLADIRPISFGLVSLEQVERNIELQFSEWKED